MNIKEIFYTRQCVRGYELFTHTLTGEDKKIHTIYEVVWHTLKDTIRDEITKEEYDTLLKELEND